MAAPKVEVLDEKLLDKKDITKTIFQNYDKLGIQHVIIRGSWIYGSQDEQSDTDILVIVTEEIVPDKDIPETKEGELVNEQASTLKYEIDNLDIAIISLSNYQKNVNDHCVSAVETMFIPEEFILFGNLEKIKEDFLSKMQIPVIRKYFSKISDHAWNRGCKKLIHEKDNAKEHRIGKKSIYHSLRYFVCAIQICKYKKIIWDDDMMLNTRDFYFSIKNTPAADMISDELKTNGTKKLKAEYTNRYKDMLKLFKDSVFNEEQLSQYLKKQEKASKTKTKN